MSLPGAAKPEHVDVGLLIRQELARRRCVSAVFQDGREARVAAIVTEGLRADAAGVSVAVEAVEAWIRSGAAPTWIVQERPGLRHDASAATEHLALRRKYSPGALRAQEGMP